MTRCGCICSLLWLPQVVHEGESVLTKSSLATALKRALDILIEVVLGFVACRVRCRRQRSAEAVAARGERITWLIGQFAKGLLPTTHVQILVNQVLTWPWQCRLPLKMILEQIILWPHGVTAAIAPLSKAGPEGVVCRRGMIILVLEDLLNVDFLHAYSRNAKTESLCFLECRAVAILITRAVNLIGIVLANVEKARL